MTTTDAPALTPKQKQVFDLLNKGTEIKDIAKRLKISVSGVYGHIRNMRAAGVTLPGEQLNGGAPAAAITPDDGPTERITLPTSSSAALFEGMTLDPEGSLRHALEQASGRMGEITERIAQLHQEVEVLNAEHGTLDDRARKLTSALEQLS